MTIADLKNSLESKFKGANLEDVEGIEDYSVFKESAKNLLTKIDPKRTVRHGSLNLFSGIYDYAPWDDFKDKLVDFRPQAKDRRSSRDNYSVTYSEDFDRDRVDNMISIEYADGDALLRVNTDGFAHSVNVDDVSNDDLWSGTATNIETDTVLFSERSASLRLDVGVGSNYVEYTRANVLDLSDHKQQSTLFRWIYFPDASDITSVILRIGNSDAVYYEITGELQFGTKKTGWNLYKFEWIDGVETGSVDASQIDYERLIIVASGASVGVRIGNLTSKLPQPWTGVYYSKYLFKSASNGSWAETPTDDSDIVMLASTGEEQLFFYECCYTIASNMQNEDQKLKFDAMLNGDGNEVGLYDQYIADHPTQANKIHTRWYRTHTRRRGLRRR